MKSLLAILISSALVVSGYSQTRNVLVNTNNVVVQPTNFWSADASNARAGLGLGTAATNPASAFQPSSGVLSNLASSNAVNLTNLRATNIVGTIPASNIGSLTLTNISGTLAISNGGTGANDAPTARTNLGLGSTNDITNRALVLPQADGLSSSTAYGIQWRSIYPSGNGLIALSGTDDQGQTTLRISTGTMSGTTAEVALFNSSRVTFYEPLDFNNTTNVAITRTNLGLGLASSVAFSNLTLSNGAQTNLSLNLGSTNRGFYATTGPERIVTVVGGIDALQVFSNSVETATGIALSVSGAGSFGTNLQIGGPLSFSGTNAAGNAGATRTNLSLGWTALTNSNAGTGLVSVNTNGEVVSPTNFWQVAPIVAQFIESQPTTNSTTNIVGARLLHIHSLATNIVNVTNTIALPTNGTSFAGDIALVVHQGPTNSMTRVRQAGSTNDLITMTRFDEAVELVYYENEWQLNHNVAFVEPIYFSGTNAAANAAASRTNLGLGVGSTNEIGFGTVKMSSFGINFIEPVNQEIVIGLPSDTDPVYLNPIHWNNTNVRSSIGLPLAALTNTSVTNFQKAIFYTNTAPSNIGGNLGTIAAWIEIVASNGVTYKVPAYTNVP